MTGTRLLSNKTQALVLAAVAALIPWLRDQAADAQCTATIDACGYDSVNGGYTWDAEHQRKASYGTAYLEGFKIAQERSNLSLYASIKRADEVVNQELASERAKQTSLASQFQANLKRATAGDAESQYLVGKSYRDGLGVEKDESTAFDWFSKSASRGNVHGENSVGYAYLYGFGGVAKDYPLALQWLRKAAAQGNVKAEANLGDMYYNGWGVPQNYASALALYRKASAEGFDPSEASLGYMYATGTGVRQDYVEADLWYRKAANQGNSWAQGNLGINYEHGQGVKADYATAAFWYRRAARQGNDDAQKRLQSLLNGGMDIGIKVPDNPPVPPTPAEIAAKAKADADAAKVDAARQEQARIAAEQYRIAQAKAAEDARIAAEKLEVERVQLLAASQQRLKSSEPPLEAYLGIGSVPAACEHPEIGSSGSIEMKVARPTQYFDVKTTRPKDGKLNLYKNKLKVPVGIKFLVNPEMAIPDGNSNQKLIQASAIYAARDNTWVDFTGYMLVSDISFCQ